MKEVYLGDGLYAAHDGYRFILRAPNSRIGGDHVVTLEPKVLDSFLKFVEQKLGVTIKIIEEVKSVSDEIKEEKERKLL